jgi:hypothetical protein
MQTEHVIRSLEALMEAETEVADGFLIAACYTRAIREGRTPRDVLDALWKALPGDDAWPGLRDALVGVIAPDDD